MSLLSRGVIYGAEGISKRFFERFRKIYFKNQYNLIDAFICPFFRVSLWVKFALFLKSLVFAFCMTDRRVITLPIAVQIAVFN